MRDTEGRQTLRLAVGAALAGVAWAYLRHHGSPRRTMLALTQAAMVRAVGAVAERIHTPATARDDIARAVEAAVVFEATEVGATGRNRVYQS